MLYAQKVAAALEAKRASFTHVEQTFTTDLAAYRGALAALGTTFPTRHALEAMLAGATGGIGARPLTPYDAWAATAEPNQPPVVPFRQQFTQHEDARRWAESVVTGVTTVAVDGSQIMPWRDVSIPVALVQAGIFVNPHDGARPYTKDVMVEVLGPEDVAPPAEDQDDPEVGLATAEALVNLRRFALETRTIADWMRSWQGPAGEPTPIALFDGSLIVSFALKMLPQLREAYITAITDLLLVSEQTQIPLVAYIDTSTARDLVTMLGAAFADRGLPESRRITDALVCSASMAWGDHTVPFLSARGDVLPEYREQGAIAFTYVRAAADRPPARLELPRWVVESGDLPRVLDVVRAELIVGGGYPYAIETADAVAVISVADRARFYQQFQQFAAQASLPLTFSHKSLSKSRRR